MLKFIVNDKILETNAHPGTILIDYLRDELKLYGTKEGCKEGECGACTVLAGTLDDKGNISYKSVASCILPIGDVNGSHIVSIEGVNQEELNTIQKAIFDYSASQCGFCTPGIVLSLTYFALSSSEFSYKDAEDALDGNLCRCTGYVAIRNAAKALSDLLKTKSRDMNKRIDVLLEAGVLPSYFAQIPQKLKKLNASSASSPSAKARIIAGGTDLFVQIPDQLVESDLKFISERKDLNYIRVDGNCIRIGAATSLEDFRNSCAVNKYFPFMKDDVLLHSSMILRNKATLAGNIVNASPIGDITIMLLALNASIVIDGNGKTREIALDKFYKDYKKFDLSEGEIIKEILVPFMNEGVLYNFEKVSNRKILDIAAVNSSILIETNGMDIAALRISAGGVASIPLMIGGLDNFRGKEISYETVNKLAEYVVSQVAPIDDVRGSANYKKLLIRQLIFAHFNKLFGVKVCAGEGC
ncbi:MAG TPA: (2Fe-2S)-binding protein [Lentisphaeria bacterium]|nr:MAG: hypothetical protein A2X47_09705 [Lentisphaerae bacterium GWF2_38_69]HBM16609.1 (2Fe-2S)-binding protein [Lentisphaeria bacterium]